MKKRCTSIILILAIVLSTFIPVSATETGDYLKQAEKLKLLGVFQGTGNGFELGREATRIEGLVMLIRLLGREEQAKTLINEPSPFTDVPDWARGYVNYAYKNGLSKGIGNNLFGSNDKINAKAYLTFMLRALEYDDSKGDFSYNQVISFAEQKGILTAQDSTELTSKTFLRDHVAKISMLSLKTNIKGKSINLLEKLLAEGVILKTVADQIDKTDDLNLEVHFIDVGQADAILIKKGNEAMLIDAGNNTDGDLIVNYIKEQNIQSLKYVVATHPHEDHIGGLDYVIDTFEIGKIIMSDLIVTSKTFEDVLDSISRKGLFITKAKVGERYYLNGAKIIILAPNGESYANTNDYSVVVKIVNDQNSFLFTGDAEKPSEIEMINKNKELLKSDVLKLGHHGSTTSTTQEFLDIVNPKYAVITTGENNKYGHPDHETLDKLENKKVQVYRTDLDGTIIAISDGNKISFNKRLGENNIPNTEIPPIVKEPTQEINSNVIISNLDKVEEIITIKNMSPEDMDLTGWSILSVKGNQRYVFPEYILRANSTVTVTSGGIEGDLVWGMGNIWNNLSSDPAVLFDAGNNQIFRFED